MEKMIKKGIKFIIKTTPEINKQLEEFRRQYHKVFRAHSKNIKQNYLTLDGKFKPEMCITKKGKQTGNAGATKIVRMHTKKDLENYARQEGFLNKSLQRCMASQGANRYYGFWKRNRKSPRKIIGMRQHKGCAYNELLISYKDGKLVIPILHGKKLILDVFIPKTMQKYLPYIKTKFGGNLFKQKNSWIFMAVVSIPWKSSYKAKDVVGFDMGKRHFLVFSEPWNLFIKRSEEQTRIEQKLVDIQKKIHDKSFKSSQRSLFRRQWKNLIRKLKNILRPIAIEIVRKAQKEQIGIAIDGATPCSKMTSFGQQIAFIIEQLCVKHKVPFVVSNPAYTSQTCPKCGFRSKKNRKNDDFHCLSCGFKEHADVVGAINTKNQLKDQIME
jgi:transposase